MGSGIAALAMLVTMAGSGMARGSLSLPTSFFHADHVFAARIAAVFAVIHAGVLLVGEPALLADLRPDGAISTLAGGAALAIMALLATIYGALLLRGPFDPLQRSAG